MRITTALVAKFGGVGLPPVRANRLARLRILELRQRKLAGSKRTFCAEVMVTLGGADAVCGLPHAEVRDGGTAKPWELSRPGRPSLPRAARQAHLGRSSEASPRGDCVQFLSRN